MNTSHSNHQSGVALVMTLGVLTIMVMLAVAFAIYMRTERVAAGNYVDNVRARHLVHVGLARAMDRLATELGTNGMATPGGGKMYPTVDVWLPSNTFVGPIVTNQLVTNAAGFLPDIPEALIAAIMATNAIGNTNWLGIPSGTNTEGPFIGRVSYVILNCSGLLDANYVGGASRGIGTNPNEIAILPPSDPFFVGPNGRESHVRYETVEELKALNDPTPEMFVYSYATSGWWHVGVSTSPEAQVNLAGSFGTVKSNETAIKKGFEQCKFSSDQQDLLFNMLIDYLDPSLIPQTVAGPSLKPVPMINEIVFSNTLSITNIGGASNVYTLTTSAFVEFWYPFDKVPMNPFTLKFKSFGADQSSFNLTSSIDSSCEFSIQPNSFFVKITNSPTVCVTNVAAVPVSIKVVSSVNTVAVESAGSIVDGLSSVMVLTNTFSGSLTPPVNSKVAVVSCEVIDPRFNWDPTSTSQWVHVPSASLTRTNSTTNYLNRSHNDGDTAMYHAGKPLRSVAELGCLPYTNWTTIKLYGTNLHRVLDVFGLLDDDVVGSLRNRGRVNPNTRQTNVMVAVFTNMPKSEDPDTLTPILSAQPEVLNAATQLMHGAVCTNLSDMGLYLTNFPGCTTELQREAFFRNTCNLFTVRQQLFTIIIEAHAASSELLIPKNPARQRAVAIVYRDAYTGEMFVRSLKWLKD